MKWWNQSWNPVTGCTPASEGCEHCYARAIHERFNAEPFSTVTLHPDRLTQPLRWRKPRVVFANSMSDLFHEDVPDEFLFAVWDVMRQCESDKFLILTKRAARMRDFVLRLRFDSRGSGRVYLTGDPMNRHDGYCLGAGHLGCSGMQHVWLGVTAENQQRADERIPLLLQTPAAGRFVSIEPMLGPVDLQRMPLVAGMGYGWANPLDGRHPSLTTNGNRGPSIDWIIAGGESGPKARPCHIEWLRSVVQQSKAAGVPVFVKQLGARILVRNDRLDEWPREGDGLLIPDVEGYTAYQGETVEARLVDRSGSDPSGWPEDLRVREVPEGLCLRGVTA